MEIADGRVQTFDRVGDLDLVVQSKLKKKYEFLKKTRKRWLYLWVGCSQYEIHIPCMEIANGLVQIFDRAGNLRLVQSKAGDLGGQSKRAQKDNPGFATKFYFLFPQLLCHFSPTVHLTCHISCFAAVDCETRNSFTVIMR